MRVQYSRAGHLFGAASIRVEHAGASIIFSGDLGRSGDPLRQRVQAELGWRVDVPEYRDETQL